MSATRWSAQEALSITLQTKPSHDGYQKVVLAATRDGFSVTRSSWLDASDIDRFAAQVHMWQELDGGAELLGEHGTEFSLRRPRPTRPSYPLFTPVCSPYADPPRDHDQAPIDGDLHSDPRLPY